MPTMATVFLTATPEFNCFDHFNASPSGSWMENTSKSVLTNHATCFVNSEKGAEYSSKIPCEHWQYSSKYYQSSIVTEWNLVCSEAYKITLVKSMYLFGYLLGSFTYGWISDRYGRHRAWVISVMAGSVAGVTAALVTNYWAFLLSRTVQAMSTHGCFITSWVLVMEMVSVEDRSRIGVVLTVSSSVAGLLITGIAYCLQNYVWIQLTAGLAGIVLCPYYWLLSESPRWLIKSGRLNQTNNVLTRMARMNGTKIPTEFETALLADSSRRMTNKCTAGGDNTARLHTMLDLFKSRIRILTTLDIFLYWFVVTVVYYGLSFSATTLAGNPYLNVCISSVVEIPGYCMNFIVLNKVGRIRGLAGYMLVAGLSCLAVAIIPDDMSWLGRVMFMVGKIFSCAAFGAIYTYTGEFYPTVIRSIGMGTGSMCARVGGLLAPFVTDFGSPVWGALPQVVFGSLALLAGCAISLMPETQGRQLPETMQEGDELAREMLLCGHKRRQTKTGGQNEKSSADADEEAMMDGEMQDQKV